ncbi:unnamed protein product [Arctogadus glacialis]
MSTGCPEGIFERGVCVCVCVSECECVCVCDLGRVHSTPINAEEEGHGFPNVSACINIDFANGGKHGGATTTSLNKLTNNKQTRYIFLKFPILYVSICLDFHNEVEMGGRGGDCTSQAADRGGGKSRRKNMF